MSFLLNSSFCIITMDILTFSIILIGIGVSLFAYIARLCFASKCTSIDCCFDAVHIKRDIDHEMMDIPQPQPHITEALQKRLSETV